MNPSFNNIRKGHKYLLKNHGETSQFQVLQILSDRNCLLKDIQTLETYYLEDLIRYGIGKDFQLREI